MVALCHFEPTGLIRCPSSASPRVLSTDVSYDNHSDSIPPFGRMVHIDRGQTGDLLPGGYRHDGSVPFVPGFHESEHEHEKRKHALGGQVCGRRSSTSNPYRALRRRHPKAFPWNSEFGSGGASNHRRSFLFDICRVEPLFLHVDLGDFDVGGEMNDDLQHGSAQYCQFPVIPGDGCLHDIKVLSLGVETQQLADGQGHPPAGDSSNLPRMLMSVASAAFVLWTRNPIAPEFLKPPQPLEQGVELSETGMRTRMNVKESPPPVLTAVTD